MKRSRILSTLRNFFFPPPDSRFTIRLLPYLAMGVLTLVVFVGGLYAWEYTNSPEFCGTVCHTMPPEFASYLVSPHARVDCVECHIGRGFVGTRFTRKVGDIKHIISLAFKSYEFPIRADDLRPARETCERCHFPEKFSDDSLREIKHFKNDLNNTLLSTYLTLKTGGGTKRLGLGRGIHWHIENQVYFMADDPEEQSIPFIRVIEEDGSATDYIELEYEIDSATVKTEDLKLMDCITCHNRITHLIFTPEAAVDQMLARKIISPTIPEIRRKGLEVLRAPYATNELAVNGIAGLESYYQAYHADFYDENNDLIQAAISSLQDYYNRSVFPEQNADWNTHPNNMGHQDTPGCFRCHDGKHLNAQNEGVRLECNLCHSVPVVTDPSDLVAKIEVTRGLEPQSHFNPNWIGMHRDVFDATCANCHTTEDPGGLSNISFCSNSACHGSVYEFAGFDAPGLREIILEQLPEVITEAPLFGNLTYNEIIGSLLETRCGACHGEDGVQGFEVTTYNSLIRGGISGPGILPGDPEGSLTIQKITSEAPHFAQLTTEELDRLIEWITVGAPER
ncbi:MAG: hypothetical protein GTO14_02090 [Anaerolineales bacterium]|nr:hypothetical protein [Anaerolineales bacterium]